MNVVLLFAALAVTIIVLAPKKLSTLAIDEEIAVIAGMVVLVLIANVFLLRRLVGPVQALTAFARRVDLSSPGERLPAGTPASEVGELASTFNEMLTRLQDERRDATGRVLAAQEAERLRIAQELHDQVGQELTAVLLGLSRAHSDAPPDVRGDLAAVRNLVRASLETVRRIAIDLRPEALDDLGLQSALAVLAERFSQRLGLDVAVAIAPDLPELHRETELVVYRVAQEALTNVARHAGVDCAELHLAIHNGRLTLSVRDRGRGLAAGSAPGTGMRGMRERATLIGGQLQIENLSPDGGCEVRLEVPLEALR